MSFAASGPNKSRFRRRKTHRERPCRLYIINDKPGRHHRHKSLENPSSKIDSFRGISASSRLRLDGKGADFRPRPASAYPRAPLLHVVVEEELIWMRTQTQRVMLFALGRNPHVEEIAGEDVAFEQE